MRSKLYALAAATLCAALSAGLVGCEALAAGEACDEYRELRDVETRDAELLSEIPVEGPYPMALVLSQPAVNDLLAAVTDHDLPSVTKRFDGFKVKLSPELPTIQIDTVRGCANCVLADMDFRVTVTVDVFGSFSGRGSIRGGVPITLTPLSAKETALIAGLGSVSVQDLDLSVSGLDLDDLPSLERVVEDLAEEYLREELGDRELSRFASFEIGEGQVLLAARGPTIVPSERTILVGLHSNLPLEPSLTLEQQAALPDGAEAGLSFHPGLLLAMARRLMSEGVISRDYDEEGHAVEEGAMQVSLLSLQAADSGLLDTTFRVYALDGLCGTVDVAAELGLSLGAAGVELSARNLRVLDGQGAGEIIKESAWAAGDFLQSLSGSLALTLNHRGFEVGTDGSAASFSAASLHVDGRGLTVFLDVD